MVGKFKRRVVQGCSLHEGLESVGSQLLSGIQVEINWFFKLGHQMLLPRITAGNRICVAVSRPPAGHAEIRRASVYTTGRGSIALAFGPAVAERRSSNRACPVVWSRPGSPSSAPKAWALPRSNGCTMASRRHSTPPLSGKPWPSRATPSTLAAWHRRRRAFAPRWQNMRRW